MPTYLYTAISQSGKSFSGSKTAKSKRVLAASLRSEGLVLTSADEEKKASPLLQKLQISIGGVSVKDKLFLVRNLKVLISAGVGLPKALSILADQTGNGQLKKGLNEMREQIVRGETLAQAMGHHANIFPDLFQSMVQVGEESGTLEDVLMHLALQLEREHELKSRIQGALLYPAVVLTAMSAVGITMLVVVVPELAKTFGDLGVPLPLTTRIIIAVGEFLKQFWYIAVGIGVAGIIALRWGAKTSAGGKLLDAFFLRLPFLSELFHKTNAAIIIRTLSSLIAAGVPLLRALSITSSVVRSASFRHSLTAAAEEVRKGAKLSEALQPYEDLYPINVLQMVQVGEETGQTAEVLAKLADFFEEEVANATKNIATVIEPLLMLIIGGVVGFFAISMIQPMYGMLGSI
ncbi:MAG: type II secretion system F family protein [Candidatus Yanofskybacteria bacterium]|nr:type II secretion system F family protein [Candidatus Yanofskybacteria bacterium]